MKSSSAFLLALALVSGAAFAGGQSSGSTQQDSPPHHENDIAQAATDEFSKLDTNHDGTLSRAELAKHPKAAHMAMVDEDQDGLLSRDEFEQLQGM